MSYDEIESSHGVIGSLCEVNPERRSKKCPEEMEPVQWVKVPGLVGEWGEDKEAADARVHPEQAPMGTVFAQVVERRFPISKERRATRKSVPIAGPA